MTKSVMSPKSSEIPTHVRSRIITLHEKGESYREIAKKVAFTFSAVRYVIKRFQDAKTIVNAARKGRPKKLKPRNERSVIQKVRKNAFLTAPALADDLALTSGITVHPQTVRNLLHSAGFHGRCPRKKPFISETNRLKRLQFAQAYINKSATY